MRVGIVRSDISHIYLQDVENRSQRNFSSQPPGQSRYFHKPTDAELQAVLNANAPLTIQGTDNAASVATNGANGTKLNIKTAAAAPFTQVVVTSGAAVPKATIITDLNNQFVAAGLGLVARLGAGTNKVTIDTTAKGQNAYIEISAGSPSAATLQTVLGLAVAATSPMTIATLKNAIYVGVTALAGQTGAAASVASPDGVHAVVTGLTGMTAGSVGHGLTLSGSGSAGNNGTFVITAFISATSVQIANVDAATDGGGGITWTEYVSVGINVAPATINALSTFALLKAADQTNLDTVIADAVAPSLVETGMVLLSFVYGNLSKWRLPSFQPGGTRGGLPPGVAAAIVANDGSTVFTV